MHGTLEIGKHRPAFMQWPAALMSGVVQILHDLMSLQVWRVALTIVSGITTTYGLMLLYDTLGGGDHGKGSLGFLSYLIPITVAGALHAAILWSLTRMVTTRRARYALIGFFLQVIAICASFGTHWVHINGGGATTDAFLAADTSTERGIRAFAVSYDTVVTQTAALAEHSRAQAAIEEKGGGRSCGSEAGDGKGPRYDLRMADRAMFTSFSSEVAARKLQLNELVKRSTTLTVSSADEAMARLANLRSLVSEAKARFESDPLLEQIRKAAEARILTGKGPISIPPTKRGKKRETQFTCFDAELERRLGSVISAINGLKPLAEVDVPDFRDPKTGFPFALGRLAQMLPTFNFSFSTRDSLKADRVRALASRNAAPAQNNWSEIAPLSLAAAIEALLALLFLLGFGTLPRHPGMDHLAELLERADVAVFDRVWMALGGSENPNEIRDTLDAYSKFEGRKNWVIVPLYGTDNGARVLHRLMEIMTEVGLARHAYSGRGIRARWYMCGWDPVRREHVAKQAVRIYRMSAAEYMTFTLDALKRERGPKTLQGQPSGIDGVGRTTATDDAVSALVNLGYRRSQADAAVTTAARSTGDDADVATLIRQGLKQMTV